MSVNVSSGDIFRTTEHFVTRLDVVMQHHKPECSVENWIAAMKVKVRAEVKMSVFVQVISSNQLKFCYQTWYCDASS